jgi:hypothetical protein
MHFARPSPNMICSCLIIFYLYQWNSHVGSTGLQSFEIIFFAFLKLLKNKPSIEALHIDILLNKYS